MSEGTPEEPRSLESVVFDLVGRYLMRKLKSKYDLDWESAKAGERRKEFDDKKAKLARDAFLAIRARTGSDFIEYFVATLCSVPQFLPEQTFLSLSQQLYSQTDRVRTLTLLALSARS